MTDLEKRLLALQQKIESLNAEVAALVALTSAPTSTQAASIHFTEAKSSAKRSRTTTATTPVGLDRFRQLAEDSV